MIDRVHFENFKSLQDVTVHLGRFTVLVGANGCGKSSVLQGISKISVFADLFDSSNDEQVGAMFGPQFRYRGTARNVAVGLYNNLAELRINTLFDSDPPRTTYHRRGSEDLARSVYLRLDTNQMSITSVIADEIPSMAPSGHGLASTLAWLKGAAEDEFAQITADLRQVVPGVKRIRTLRERVPHRRIDKIDVDGQPVWRPVDEMQIGDRFSIEFDDGSDIPSNMLSEGTVLALGLLTKLREPTGRTRLLIDDIDRGLHLGAQASLLKVLRELLKLDAELQIICTTHSPYLLDLFEPEEVRVLALDSERRTHVRPLTEHPDFEKWKSGTQTGELWAALGEDWVLAGATG